MRQSLRLIYNSIFMWGSTLASVLPQFIIMPFLLKHIGPEKYGIFALIWSLRYVLMWAKESMANAIIKYCAEPLSDNHANKVNGIFSTTMVYHVAFGFIGLLFYVVYAYVAPLDGMFEGNVNVADIQFSIIVFGIMILLVIGLNPYQGMILALQRYDLFSVTQVTLSYLRLGVVYAWFLLIGASLEALVIITAISSVLLQIIMALIAYRKINYLKFRIKLVTWDTFILLFKFSSVLALTVIFVVMKETVLKWVAGAMISISFVTYMAIIRAPTDLYRRIILAMTLTVLPAASSLNDKKDFSKLEDLFIRGTRYASILGAGAIISIVFLGKPLLILWVGNDYAFLTPYIIIIFSATALNLTSAAAHHIIRGLGRLKFALYSSGIGEAILPITLFVLSYLLLKDGYVAYTIGISVAGIVYGTMRIIMCGISLKMDLRKLVIHSYIPPFSVAIVLGVLEAIVVSYFNIESFLYLLIITCTVLLLAVVIFYFFLSTDIEKKLVKEIFSKVTSKVKPGN